MTALVGSLLATWWQPIAAALAGIAALGVAYLKGRSTERRKIENEDLRNANDTRKSGADARDRAAADVAAGRLRDNDGHRRD